MNRLSVALGAGVVVIGLAVGGAASAGFLPGGDVIEVEDEIPVLGRSVTAEEYDLAMESYATCLRTYEGLEVDVDFDLSGLIKRVGVGSFDPEQMDMAQSDCYTPEILVIDRDYQIQVSETVDNFYEVVNKCIGDMNGEGNLLLGSDTRLEHLDLSAEASILIDACVG